VAKRMIRGVSRCTPPILLDALVVLVSLMLAWSARSITADLDVGSALRFGLIAAAVYCVANARFSLYRRIWRYASATEVSVIAASAAIGTTIMTAFDLLSPGRRQVPLSVVFLMGFFSFAGFVGVRYRSRILTGMRWRTQALHGQTPPARIRVLILGAGEAGQLMAWRLLNQREGEAYRLVGFVDDDPAKLGMKVHGLPILGDRHAIPSLVAKHHVDLIILAIYSITGQAFRDLLAICETTPARVKVLPNIFDFIQRTNGLPPIRDVTAEDLLGRKPVQIDRNACQALLAGKTIVVTGAAGSIGSELCRQIASFGPRLLLMLDNNESGLYDLQTELASVLGPAELRCVVGDVTHRRKVQTLFEAYHPDVVFHAAAYKHVPLMEAYPDEAVRVNVLGTLTVAQLACQHRTGRFVFISTDKAVSPTCIMGATKRIGEMLVLSMASEAQTLLTGVRFGNVLGSRGSVVPTFEKQIEMGGPITITHPEMTRYFMSIPEAVSLVIQAATVTQGGDLFVLDMGEQIRIEELALRLIRLRGLRPGVDIPIKYTGVRPGEKLHEELTGDGDERQPTTHPSIFRVRGNHRVELATLLAQIQELGSLADAQGDGATVRKLWAIVGQAPVAVFPPRRQPHARSAD